MSFFHKLFMSQHVLHPVTCLCEPDMVYTTGDSVLPKDRHISVMFLMQTYGPIPNLRTRHLLK